MIKINLLPVRANQKKEKLQEQIILLVVILGVAAIGCGVSFATMLGKISAKKEQIAQQQKTIEDLKKKIGEVEKVKKLQEQLQAKLDVLNKLKLNKTGPSHLFDELASAIPDKIWIDSLENTEGKISLSGMGVNEDVVATFMEKLEASPYVAKVELESLELTVKEDNKLHKFKMTATVEMPGMPAGAGENKEQQAAPEKKSS